MARIFISHSRRDKDIIALFDRIFAGIEAARICMEFEDFELPPWKAIKQAVLDSIAVFILLGQGLKTTQYTENWVAFEVGLACEMAKPVWVFERIGEVVKFPIPYLDHYILYDPENKTHLNLIRQTIEAYSSFLGLGILYKLPRGNTIICPHGNCGIEFQLYNKISQINCPSCRQSMEIEWD